MTQQPLGNASNMEMVKQLMELKDQAGQVNLGGNLTHTEAINYTSEEGNVYAGTVVFKKPDMMDTIRMGAIKSELLRSAGVRDARLVDNGVLYMATAIATLQIVAVQRPAWLLNPQAINEADVLYHVFDKYERWMDSFRKPVSAEQAGAGEDSAGTQGMVSED